MIRRYDPTERDYLARQVQDERLMAWVDRNWFAPQALIIMDETGYMIGGLGQEFDKTTVFCIMDVKGQVKNTIFEQVLFWAKTQGAKAVIAQTKRAKAICRKYGFHEVATLIRKEL